MKKSKPFYKHVWFIIFIILVVIGGISSLTKPKSKPQVVQKSLLLLKTTLLK